MFQDLLYFGDENDSRILQSEFLKDFSEIFHECKTEDASDDIHGYRRTIHIPEDREDDYFAFLIAYGWTRMSLGIGLITAGIKKEDSDRVHKLIDLASAQYPDRVKPIK